ncbi:MAG: alpha/beta fold hydrolase [Acidimicrobiales bacterium]
MTTASPHFCLIPGAGSAGLTWSGVQRELPTVLLPIPDRSSIAEMADSLEDQLQALKGPRVLVGASLGAMVALELAHRVPIDALVFLATGFGIEVSASLLDWVEMNPPDLFKKMARISVMSADDDPTIDLVVRDFELRGQPTVLHHLQALASYRPVPLDSPPPTFVIWGMKDQSVPLEAHVELAAKCRGAVVPMADAKHMPFLEQPVQTARWMTAAYELSRVADSTGR